MGAFADTKSNPGPDVVREFLARFGITEPGKKLETKMGSSQGSTNTVHVSFIKLRNECARTGTALTVPTTNELRTYCDFLENLATGIESALQDHLHGAPLVVTPPTPTVAVAAVAAITPFSGVTAIAAPVVAPPGVALPASSPSGSAGWIKRILLKIKLW